MQEVQDAVKVAAMERFESYAHQTGADMPVYYKFLGGGDMNGILLFGIPEIIIQVIYGVIALLNVLLIIKRVYPANSKAFRHRKCPARVFPLLGRNIALETVTRQKRG